jgi:hypothetical protein
VNADEALGTLIATPEQIRQLLPPDKAAWDRDPVIKLAIERLWITAGNLAEAYRTEAGIVPAVEPWSELAGYRHLLRHAVPSDLSADRVFAETTNGVDRLLRDLRAIGR